MTDLIKNILLEFIFLFFPLNTGFSDFLMGGGPNIATTKFNKKILWNFAEPATTTMTGIIDLHHTIFFYLLIIFILVSYLLVRIILTKETIPGYVNHCPNLETIWTVLPIFIIAAILVPSLALLYSSETIASPELTIKVTGHQWYWSYEYSDLNSNLIKDFMFDSYIKQKQMKLLADPYLVLPVHTCIRFLISSDDVIHSWAVPSWGVKMDAIPGQTNQVIVTILKIGYYYGQCSELCGIGHGFMPISIYVLRFEQYLYWLITKFTHNFYLSMKQGLYKNSEPDLQDSFKTLLFEEYLQRILPPRKPKVSIKEDFSYKSLLFDDFFDSLSLCDILKDANRDRLVLHIQKRLLALVHEQSSGVRLDETNHDKSSGVKLSSDN